MSGTITDTYAAALQHDLVDLPDDAALVGVVRRPTGWFNALVDENVPALGPPEDLLSACKERQRDLRQRGLCDEEAHNAAWNEVDFESRYRDHLADDADAAAALARLVERASGGETVALVCFEGDDKRCHRRTLVEEVERRLEAAAE